ncbi:MAG: hypothetical protein ACI8WM_001127 [Burkholderiaceae bacterium]|jgi:hypothetical protein
MFNTIRLPVFANAAILAGQVNAQSAAPGLSG